MKLPNKVNPAACISKDGTRYTLTKVRVQDGLAQATDGRVMFVTQCPSDDEDEITEGFVPGDAMKQSLKNKVLNRGEFRFRKNPTIPEISDVEVQMNLDGKSLYNGVDMGKWPRLDKAVPNQAKPFTIEFSTKLLAKIVAAFGDEVVSLTADLEAPGNAIIVTCAKQPAAFAILMPNNASKRDKISDHFEPVQNRTIDMLVEAGKKLDSVPPTPPTGKIGQPEPFTETPNPAAS